METRVSEKGGGHLNPFVSVPHNLLWTAFDFFRVLAPLTTLAKAYFHDVLLCLKTAEYTARQPTRGNHRKLHYVPICLSFRQGGDQSGILMGSWMVANRLGLRLWTVFIIYEEPSKKVKNKWQFISNSHISTVYSIADTLASILLPTSSTESKEQPNPQPLTSLSNLSVLGWDAAWPTD